MYEIYGGTILEDICIQINGQSVTCPPGTSILKAAEAAGIFIPTLCYLKGLTPTGVCGVCVVEVEIKGKMELRRACRYPAKDGMVILTDTQRVIEYRNEKITKLLEKHPNDCLTCAKSGGDCKLQEVAQMFQINPEVRILPNRGLDESSAAMYRDKNKCIACGRCIRVCKDVQKIGLYRFVRDGEDRYVDTFAHKDLAKTPCINCGQCVKVCPVGALVEKDGIQKAQEALSNPKKTVVWQMAPAIENVIGEDFGFKPGTDVTKRIAAAMKKAGGKAYATDFSADVTIMEEGTEFISRLKEKGTFPMITSCCPGWIKFMEYNYPDLLPHLSSCKSPQQMFGALVKSYLPEKIGVAAEDIFHISIMPCVAKKYEYQREEMQNEAGIRDVDLVLTAREAAKLFRTRGIDLQELQDEEFDAFFGEGTGAARIFAATGGVMEAALRTVAVVLTGGELDTIEYETVRGFRGVKTAKLSIAGTTVQIAVVNGIGNVRPILDEIREGKSPYQFIEVMACPGGCVNGGGTPIKVGNVERRKNGLYQSDQENAMRRSHENPSVKALYEEFLKEPCGSVSHHLLHTHYVDRTDEY